MRRFTSVALAASVLLPAAVRAQSAPGDPMAARLEAIAGEKPR